MLNMPFKVEYQQPTQNQVLISRWTQAAIHKNA